nr:immunoglobulin heavy chain junction region [Mus musculus]
CARSALPFITTVVAPDYW